MITLVISGGDSFTFGSELGDDWLDDTEWRASKFSWANLVANKLNAKHINTGEGGRSNSYIVRHVINKIYEALQHNYKPDEIFVQVMWTFIARQEIAINSDTKRWDSPWFPIDPYVVGDESKADWFKEVDKNSRNFNAVRDGLRERYNINKGLGLVDFAKEYYKVTGNLNDRYTSLKEMLMLQDFLDNRSIKYMFTYVSEHVMNGLLLVQDNKFTNGLQSFINFDEWYKFPGNKEFMGFNDWAKANGYPYATSHPLEQAHEDAAELLYEKARQILTGGVGPLPGE